MHKTYRLLVGSSLIIFLSQLGWVNHQRSGSLPANPPAPSIAVIEPKLDLDFGQMPLYFIENQGQLDEQVAYYIQGSDKTIYFTDSGVTFALTAPITSTLQSRPPDERGSPFPISTKHSSIRNPKSAIQTQRWSVKLDFVGANPDANPVGLERAEAVISYFKGKPDDWHTGLPTYNRIVYKDLWHGIDLVYFGDSQRLKYEFIVHPGADPAQVQLAYRGASDVRLNSAGQLEVTTPLGGFSDDTPLAYQEIDGQQVAVEVNYDLAGDSAFRSFSSKRSPSSFNQQSSISNQKFFAFSLGHYDPSLPLVIDPTVIVYAGYIGGSGYEYGSGISVDGAGNAYITGDTSSSEASFPAMAGPDLTYNGSADAFVVKVNFNGAVLDYAGYIGGSYNDIGIGIAVDGAGNAYITGHTYSAEDSFPATVGPDLTHNGFGYYDAFVAKVNSSGAGLVYAGYIGGSDHDTGKGIAVDGAGNAYVTGFTYSSEASFPVTIGPDLTYNGGYTDAFVVKVNSSGAGLVYSGYIGGSDHDQGRGIAVDGAGNAYVTGFTESSEASFPVTVGPDLTHNGSADAFVAKVNANGAALVYSGYIGGSNSDECQGIAVDGAGNAYVTGTTTSSEASFPAMVGPDLTYNGGIYDAFYDAFVVKVTSNGTGLVYAGYIGGSSYDQGYGIAVDGAGNAYVTGYTYSNEASFPVTVGPDLTHNGNDDAFVAKVTSNGTGLVYAGYVGGSSYDQGYGIAVDDVGNAYITGYTTSSGASFPATVGPDLTYNGGYNDAFVAKVGEQGGAFGQPILLVHGWHGLPGSETRHCSEGVGRYGEAGIVNTFGDMAQWFEDSGYDVWIAHLDTGPAYTPPIEMNAHCLNAQVAAVHSVTNQQVILVGHSMGGLVSRACLNLNECHDNVSSVYTLGSPHAGIISVFLLRLLAHFRAPIVNELICAWQPAVCQFTTDGALWFNLSHPNREGKDYRFIGGIKTPFPLGWMLLPLDGPNDGTVGAHSAVGWIYPTRVDAMPGPDPGRYWTDEAHTDYVGHPSYFEPSGGSESQAFRCLAWLMGKRDSADCIEATQLQQHLPADEPILSSTTTSILGNISNGEIISHTLLVDTTEHSLFYLSWITGTITMTLTQPGGQIITPGYALTHSDVVTYTTGVGGNELPPFASYVFTDTLPGTYIMTISSGDVGSIGTDYQAFVAMETQRNLDVDMSSSPYQVGQTAAFTATLEGPSGDIPGAVVQAELLTSDSITETLLLDDLGNGVYTANWLVPDSPGFVRAIFTAEGDDTGDTFTRELNRLLTIASHSVQLSGLFTDQPVDTDGNNFNDFLEITAGFNVSQEGTYLFSADIMVGGQVVAHASQYQALAQGTQEFILEFDGWDIRRSRINGPYILTNLYLTDVGGGGIPALSATEVWITGAYHWYDFGFEQILIPYLVR